ncbi:MAG: hypothetical protein EP341_01960 [Sphingomonadales bacterium]|nr:hypothetical protein [Pseudodonghicola xiamenensis]TNE59685.1 MAG: hypothetical protein EP341_01960 [Sphingomonadales bacterium]
MAALKKGADQIGLDVVGTPIMPGNMMNRNGLRFHVTKGVQFHPIPGWSRKPSVAECEKRFYASLSKVGAASLGDIDVPVISNLGCRPFTTVEQLRGYSFDPSAGELFISRSAVEKIIFERMGDMLKIAEWVCKRVPKFCLVFPPVAKGSSREMWSFFEDRVFSVAREFGAITYSTVEWGCLPAADGGLKPEYQVGMLSNGVDDQTHGNTAFGAVAIQDCLSLLRAAPASLAS